MTTETAILLSALIGTAIVFKWYGDRKEKEIQSEFFRKQLEKQITARDEDIKELEQQVKESVDEYYKRIANHKSNLAKPSKGSD